MRIRRIDIENFRGIKSASWRLPADRRFFALIGPGDATKTTVLTAIERALHDRAGLSVLDTDFFGATVDEALRIRVAVGDLPDDLLAIDAFGGFLSGIDQNGEWTHDPADESERCIIVELLVEADLDPIWQSYRPPLKGMDDEDPYPIRARHRTKMTAYRIDDRVDAHLRWSRTSSLGKLTVSRDDTRATLTHAGRKAREAAAEAVTDSLKELAQEVQTQVQAIGTTRFGDLRPGLDTSLSNTQGNLALFDGAVPLTNFGLGTRRLTGAATQQLANQGTATLLVDEVEHGLEPHRLVHLLRHLRTSDAFSQVFVTTHSPTALMHLEPEDLVMVRSSGGLTDLKPLDEPAELRPLLKACPEAFLARRVVINEGKTEYGVVLEHLEEWDADTESDAVPSAALGVVAVEGNGGTGSANRAAQFLNLGYDVVLFVDSDDENANNLADQVAADGASVIRWEGCHSIETAVCAELTEAGLTAFIEAAIEVADDPESALTVYANALVANGAPDSSAGAETLDVSTWAATGLDLHQARDIVGKTAKGKKNVRGWFKRVDKGRRLGRFILDSTDLEGGEVESKIGALRGAIYAPAEAAKKTVVSEQTTASLEEPAGTEGQAGDQAAGPPDEDSATQEP
ncbi:ATP-dependent nuclease [Nocardioides zeae]|uniref:ATP-dependent endonuclease of OLD family n=1 Tax=Nocardioides zeae TaxID=1457234 RepID=A0AAJ1U495_9ACTN|nr:ATP-binding protein [Nocardioides zeae]MDQ1104818.1 putative ATP-dependent endonuclease of OLD family [Nocardioides zeae]